MQPVIFGTIVSVSVYYYCIVMVLFMTRVFSFVENVWKTLKQAAVEPCQSIAFEQNVEKCWGKKDISINKNSLSQPNNKLNAF